MTVLSTENLVKILDRLVDRPSWKSVMRSIGASESTAFNWRAQSIKAATSNPPDRSSPFFLEWRGAWDYWHNHAGRARFENIITYEAQIRDECLNGREVPVLGPDQRPVYREAYVGRSDDFIRIAEGLDADADVRWYRIERDAKGNPIPLTKIEMPPAPLRLAVLRQDQRYVEKSQLDVNVQGEITVQRPLARLPGEAKPDVSRLKALAAMSPEERRKALGATAVPLDAAGRRTLPVMAPKMDDKPDDQNLGARPSPYVAPYQPPPAPEPAPRPSYARPNPALDRGESTGEGPPPPGGMRVA